MELQDVINYARGQHKSDIEKQIAEKLVRLGADNWWNPICYEQDTPCKLYIQKKNED